MTSLVHTLGPLQTDPDSGLTYRLGFPVPTKPEKLLVLLHGVGSNEATVLGLADGVDAQTLVVLPRGPLPLGPQQFAWFRVNFTASGPSIVPEEAERSRETLVRFVANLQSVHGITPQKTAVAGFSQGGIMSASVALTAPHQVAGFAVLSGRILPELEPRLASPNALAHLKSFIGHGELDSKLPVHWAHRSEQWLTALGVHPVVRLYPIDHGVSAEMHHDFLQWLASLTQSPP